MKNLQNGAAQAEIRSRIAALGAGDGRRWGSMAVEEMLAHLREAYVLSVGGRVIEPITTPVPPRLMKFLALRMPVRWPHNVPTVPVLERAAMPAADEFETERARLQEAFDRFIVAGSTARHAYFGAMTRADWMRWGYLHADHHLRQFGR